MRRWKFIVPKEHVGKVVLEEFIVLKIEIDAGGVNVHVQGGYPKEDAIGNEIEFQPLTGENIRFEGSIFVPVIEQQIWEAAYNSVAMKKGPTWAGTLKST